MKITLAMILSGTKTGSMPDWAQGPYFAMHSNFTHCPNNMPLTANRSLLSGSGSNPGSLAALSCHVSFHLVQVFSLFQDRDIFFEECETLPLFDKMSLNLENPKAQDETRANIFGRNAH